MTVSNRPQPRSVLPLAACAALLLLVLVQCAPKPDRSITTTPTPPTHRIVATNRTPKTKFFGKTILDYAPKSFGHGTQIEYFDEQGNSYLWYPGNKKIVKGKLAFKGLGRDIKACFLHEENTYNPLTKTAGGKWQCQSYHNFNFFIRDIQEGDVFNLATSNDVPHVLAGDVAAPYVSSTVGTRAIVHPFANRESRRFLGENGPSPFLVNGKTPIQNLQALWEK